MSVYKESGALPEFIQDWLWNDEAGLFENALTWGGRYMMFQSGPLMVIGIIAGLLGLGMGDIGRELDKLIKGKDPASINPQEVAEQFADKFYPDILKNSAALEMMIRTAAQPIRFEEEPSTPPLSRKLPDPIKKLDTSPRPGGKNAPAPVKLDPKDVPAPVKFDPIDQKAPPANTNTTEEADDEPKKSTKVVPSKEKERIKATKKREKERRKTLELKYLLERDRDARRADGVVREHESTGKNEQLKDRLERERRLFDAAQKIETEKQMRQMRGEPTSPQEYEEMKKRELKLETERHKEKLKMDQKSRDLNLKYMAKEQAIRGAASRGNSSVLSFFKGKLGKAGIVTAIVALITSALMGGKSGVGPSASDDPRVNQSNPAARAPSAPSSRNRVIRDVNKELNRIWSEQ